MLPQVRDIRPKFPQDYRDPLWWPRGWPSSPRTGRPTRPRSSPHSTPVASDAYGPDWADRGRSHLGEAALLLAALWPSGAPAALQGSAVERVSLSRTAQESRKTRHLRNRRGLRLSPVKAAVVIGAAAAAVAAGAALTAGTGHGGPPPVTLPAVTGGAATGGRTGSGTAPAGGPATGGRTGPGTAPTGGSASGGSGTGGSASGGSASGGSASGGPAFTPPPGCTGSWNTTQAAVHNHAPGTSPGCLIAEAHAGHTRPGAGSGQSAPRAASSASDSHGAARPAAAAAQDTGQM